MEATNSTTGDSDEQTREDGIGCECCARQSLPQLRNIRLLNEKHHKQGCRHKEQGNGEKWIHLADNLIDRQHRSDEVINEDNNNPECTVTQQTHGRYMRHTQSLQQGGWAIYEHGANHHQ